MELLLAVLLGSVIVAVPAWFALRFVSSEADKSRTVAQARAVAQQTRITDLENRLMSHTWGEYAQLQNEVDNHTAQTVRSLNSFGEARAEEAYGESPEDVAEQLLSELVGDYEGPTIG